MNNISDRMTISLIPKSHLQFQVPSYPGLPKMREFYTLLRGELASFPGSPPTQEPGNEARGLVYYENLPIP